MIYQGYQDTAMILIRSLVEAIINIDYIIQEDTYNRASKYFKNGIKNVNIKKGRSVQKIHNYTKSMKDYVMQLIIIIVLFLKILWAISLI